MGRELFHGVGAALTQEASLLFTPWSWSDLDFGLGEGISSQTKGCFLEKGEAVNYHQP